MSKCWRRSKAPENLGLPLDLDGRVDRIFHPKTPLAGLFQVRRARQGSFAGGSLITVGFNGLSMVVFMGGSLLVARALGPKQTAYLMWFATGTDTISRF